MTITRFAPSPTGRLHLGHAYSAIIAHSLARQNKGKFLLRFEDIDHTRVRPEFYDGITEDLHWLGIEWDEEPWRQLDRLDHYHSALEQLKKLGVLYPYFCTRKEIESELEHLTHAPHGPEGPLYPGTCRNRSDIPPDREPAWRIDLKKASQLTGPLSFQTLEGQRTPVEADILGDVILARKDIGTSYHLAVVVDDAAQGVNLITRGEDLLPSTHIHRVLQSLLNFSEPRYAHHQLICDDSGERLAKRHDSLAISTLREQGLSPQKIRRMFNSTMDFDKRTDGKK